MNHVYTFITKSWIIKSVFIIHDVTHVRSEVVCDICKVRDIQIDD